MQLAVLIGLILLFVGFFTGNKTQVAVGLVLGSLGGLELAIREHFAGYRSHTSLLAGVVFVVTTGVLYFAAKQVLWFCLLIGVILAAGAVWLLLRRFRRVSGVSYRLR